MVSVAIRFWFCYAVAVLVTVNDGVLPFTGIHTWTLRFVSVKAFAAIWRVTGDAARVIVTVEIGFIYTGIPTCLPICFHIPCISVVEVPAIVAIWNPIAFV